MKCWPEYKNYRHLTLRNAEQLQDCADDGRAFDAFLKVAKDPLRCKVSVGGEPLTVSGAILIWSTVAKSGLTAVRQAHHLTTVLSLRKIIDDLVTWEDERYQAFLEERLGWCQQLFYGLATGRSRLGHDSGTSNQALQATPYSLRSAPAFRRA
jgi:hypothetical protein